MILTHDPFDPHKCFECLKVAAPDPFISELCNVIYLIREIDVLG